MMDFGFIGFGNMAKMLIHGLIEFSKVDPCNICVTRNNKSRLTEINNVFANVKVYNTCSEIATNARVVFLCVKPMEIKEILLEIEPFINENIHILSLAGTVSMDNLQSIVHGKISKLMPTITSEIGEGISLVCHNQYVTDCDSAFLEKYINPFGKIKIVRDYDIGFASELTSCAPGFIASIFGHFVNTALLHTSSFNLQEINEMVIHTLYATSKLLSETDMDFEQVVSRVATKGGITQEGVAVFNETLPQIFDDMFKKTLEKRHIVETKINKDFQNA